MPVLADWFRARVEPQPDATVFPFTYWPARKAWANVCKKAGIWGHDPRCATHIRGPRRSERSPRGAASEAPWPCSPRHNEPLRQHAPEQFLEQDAERVARSMGIGGSPTP